MHCECNLEVTLDVDLMYTYHICLCHRYQFSALAASCTPTIRRNSIFYYFMVSVDFSFACVRFARQSVYCPAFGCQTKCITLKLRASLILWSLHNIESMHPITTMLRNMYKSPIKLTLDPYFEHFVLRTL